jgi:hypothetical protein
MSVLALLAFTVFIFAAVYVAYAGDSRNVEYDTSAEKQTPMYNFDFGPAQVKIYNPAPSAWQEYGYQFRFRR